MRRILSLLVLTVLVPVINAQEKPAPVRICVGLLENTSRNIVNPAWERDQLVRALERTNKKFIKRFQFIEAEVNKAGKKLSEMTLAEMDLFWNEAKNLEP